MTCDSVDNSKQNKSDWSHPADGEVLTEAERQIRNY